MDPVIPWKHLFVSRGHLILLAIAFDLMYADHDADAYYNGLGSSFTFGTIDHLVYILTRPFTRWDAQYFLRIAHDFSYKDEQSLAFFPGFPTMIGTLGRHLYRVLQGSALQMNLYSCILLASMFINFAAFIGAGYFLALLTDHVFRGRAKMVKMVVLFYAYNPASIFFSAIYTESLFALSTFVAIYLVHCNTLVFNLYFASLTFGISCFIRSNGKYCLHQMLTLMFIFIGMVASVYIFYALLLQTMEQMKTFGKRVDQMLVRYRNRALLHTLWRGIGYCFRFRDVCALFFCLLTHVPFFLGPFLMFQNNAKTLFCDSSKTSPTPEWCETISQFSYSYVQNKYWNVGLFHYWQLIQVPNFLLAAPVLLLVFVTTPLYLLWWLGDMFTNWQEWVVTLKELLHLPCLASSLMRNRDLWPYAVHSLVLALVALFYMNVQVATRFLFSANPWPYWALYDIYENWNIVGVKQVQHKRYIIWGYLLIYYLLGTIAFANFYPFT